MLEPVGNPNEQRYGVVRNSRYLSAELRNVSVAVRATCFFREFVGRGDQKPATKRSADQQLDQHIRKCMRATDLLREQHAELISLLSEINCSSLAQKKIDLFWNLKDLLQHHGSLEENLFYPRVFRLPQFGDSVFAAFKQHERIEELLNELLPDDIDLTPAWNEFQHTLISHIRSEEEFLFSNAEELFAENVLEEMAGEMCLESTRYLDWIKTTSTWTA